jgi:hypothetical protein
MRVLCIGNFIPKKPTTLHHHESAKSLEQRFNLCDVSLSISAVYLKKGSALCTGPWVDLQEGSYRFLSI